MIKDLEQFLDKEIILQAFVDNIRNLQYVAFIILRDASSKIQMTVEKEGNDDLVKIIDELTIESTVKITGKLIKNEKVKLNGMEIIPNKIEITSKALAELPIDYKNKD